MGTKDTPQGIVGLKFAQALLNHEYATARSMLSPELKGEYPVAYLKQQFEQRMSLANQPPPEMSEIVVMDNGELGDASLDAKGWAYIPIWSEAVTITVKPFEAEFLVTELEWGRP